MQYNGPQDPIPRTRPLYSTLNPKRSRSRLLKTLKEARSPSPLEVPTVQPKRLAAACYRASSPGVGGLGFRV